MISTQENIDNREQVVQNWRLGPQKASVIPTDNQEYWDTMAKVWSVPSITARGMLCANCEYFDNTLAMQLEMNSIPLDSFDLDGGGRGFCERFDFICHNLRTCQAWEDKSVMDELGDEAFKSILPTLIKNLDTKE